LDDAEFTAKAAISFSTRIRPALADAVGSVRVNVPVGCRISERSVAPTE